jgi:hypothetical protein
VWILIVAGFQQPWWVGLIGGLAGGILVEVIAKKSSR